MSVFRDSAKMWGPGTACMVESLTANDGSERLRMFGRGAWSLPVIMTAILAGIVFLLDLTLQPEWAIVYFYPLVVWPGLMLTRGAGAVRLTTLSLIFAVFGLLLGERDSFPELLSSFLVMACMAAAAMAVTYLRERGNILEKVLETSSAGLACLDDYLLITSVNHRFAALFGYDVKDLIGKRVFDLIGQQEVPQLREAIRLLREEGDGKSEQKLDMNGQNKQTRDFPASFTMRLIPGRFGHSFALEVSDMSVQRNTESELWKLSSAVEQSTAATIITDLTGRIEYVNRRFCDLSGYTVEDVVGQDVSMLRSDLEPPESGRGIWQALSTGEEWHGEFHNRRKNGEYYWVEAAISPIRLNGDITHYLSVQEDISVRKDFEARLVHQARYDELTGLPNRLLAQETLDHALLAAHGTGRQVAIMIIDLDQFNEVNDSLGHSVGDRLIQEVATKIAEVPNEDATLARLGGDEFLLILPTARNQSAVTRMAQEILSAVDQPHIIGEHELYITASIGISMSPEDGQDTHNLMKNADAALFLAKRDGRNLHRFFKPNMDQTARERLELITKLKRALANEELYLVYQPLIRIETGETVAMEALIRWNHPVDGNITPDRFIPLAEETGLIREIGDWVLRRACQDLKALMKRRKQTMKVAVNISAKQFKDADFDARVSEIIREAGLVPEFLELEITERVVMADDPETAHILHRLSSSGISLSIDDFGTGYSSLSYLKKYPFDVLKIDQAFVRDVIHDSQNTALVSAIIAMAQSLNLKVIAEGVESQDQHDFLGSLNCDIAQGYLHGKPMSIEELTLKLCEPA